ncbi:UBX domain-containing protein 4 isoform X2 [Hyla sarda]|uniref:UBX domain-containing protein 4 isoform X2 n=1 Tax=Hyla sarda TaxID=327740 RepID=UPI0024C27269|nr:UBX domain-containing protein 4 isoform X2 [Hyla sarda]
MSVVRDDVFQRFVIAVCPARSDRRQAGESLQAGDMLWFQGSIPEAIAAAKQRSSVFVVFVAGDDEQSTQMAESWGNEEVVRAATEGFVAIKIDSKSETCLQFSQIYPVVCVPSSFFIGENGIPLEVIAGSISAEELIAKITKVKQMNTEKNDWLAAETDVPNDSPVTGSTESCPVSESPSTESPPEETSCASPRTTPAQSDESPTEESKEVVKGASETPDDDTLKMERVMSKLEKKMEEKKKEEQEISISKEVERRKLGKDMLEYKRKQEDEQARRALEERNREKAEDKAARERIKQQIAQDRADRAARFAKTKEEQEAIRAAELQARQAEVEARKEAAQKERRTVARIQFRLPDGSSITNQFPSEVPLEEARQFAAQTVGNTYGNFSLATMFPRREFTKEDYGKSLLSLELAPSASIVLLPAGRPARAVVQSSDGGVLGFLGTLLYPLLAVWRFISSFLFSSPPPTQHTDRPGFTQQESASSSASSSSEPKREAVRKRVLEKRADEFKKEGKIYRLRTQDDEDENNTWNGNSTQQM